MRALSANWRPLVLRLKCIAPALTVSEPIGAVIESLLGEGLALALAELKAA